MINRRVQRARRSLANIGLVAGLTALAFACARQPESETETAAAPATEAAEINVYSGRHYDSDIALFDAFTAETGVKVNLIEAGAEELIERLAREGDQSPADLFIAADAGVMWRAESRGLLQPFKDAAVLERAPAQYRHPDGYWTGLSRRARVIIYNKDAGLPEGLATYQDLARPEYAGMICIRSSTNIYNQSLLAALIAHDGAAAAEAWASGVVANFARAPEGNDTSQIEAVAAGQCRLSVVNTYYIARYLDPADTERFAIGEKIGVLFPNQETTGVHVNISGAGVTAHAPNAADAERLVAFLLRDEQQRAFARGNNEYPVVEGVAPEGPVAGLGDFRADTLSVAAYGENQAEAVRIFDRAGWR